jgi:hypothetical protein
LEKGTTFKFEVSENNLEFMEDWFEKLTKQELSEAIVIKK